MYSHQKRAVVVGIKMISEPTAPEYEWKLLWRSIMYFIVIHIFGFQGLYYSCANAQWKTLAYAYVLAFLCQIGVTAGAHRLWSHRAYKAKLPLRILLCFFETLSLEGPVYIWARDHRVHHKYTDTDADPHNSNRGFFFSHMGWTMVKKHPDVAAKGKNVDLSDLEADSVVMLQNKNYPIWSIPTSLLLPALLPWYCWNEGFYMSWCITCMLRYCFVLHSTWSINSLAHFWGSKPYDKNIRPTQNFTVAFLTFGEGWHNYHHVFPWDYKAAELGNYYGTNLTTAFIDLMAKIGWAYDLKTASQNVIKNRISRTGDGAEKIDDGHSILTWGCEDPDMKKEDMEFVEILHPKRA